MDVNVSVISLIAGFAIGLILTAAVWAAVSSGSKKKLRKQKDEREQIMFSIGELIADADAISAKFRCGSLSVEMFKRALGDKVNEITRSFRTNMHLLDVFFVKYADMQINQYLTVLENPERRTHKTAEEASAVSIAPVQRSETPAPVFAPAAPAPVSVIEEEEPEAPVQIEQAPQPVEPVPVQTSAPPIAAPAAVAQAAVLPDDEDEFVLPAAQSAVESEPEAVESEPEAVEPESEVDSWAEQSFEEYEAGFAQFEALPEEKETGDFPTKEIRARAAAQESAAVQEQAAEEEEEFFVGQQHTPPSVQNAQEFTETICIDRPSFAQVPPPQAPLAQAPIQQAPPPPIQQAFPCDQEFTETICIERPPFIQAPPQQAPLAQAPIQQTPPPPIRQQAPVQQMPPPVQAPAYQPPVAPPAPQAFVPPFNQQAQAAQRAAESEKDDGITGDDVMDSIDSFFNLK